MKQPGCRKIEMGGLRKEGVLERQTKMEVGRQGYSYSYSWGGAKYIEI